MKVHPRRFGWVSYPSSALIMAALVMGCGGDDQGSGGQAATSTGQGGTMASASGSGGAAGTGGVGGSAGIGGSGGSTGTSMGTPCAGNTCDLTFTGTGFGMFEGLTIHGGIVQQGNMGLDWQSSAPIAGGTFLLEGNGVLSKGASYFLNYYVDVDNNQICEPASDAVWRLSIPPVQEHLTITVVANMTESNIGCGGF